MGTRLLLLLIAGSFLVRPATAQQGDSYVPSDSAIAAAAAAVVQNADRCAAVWPGYWSPGKPFGLTRRQDRSIFAHLPAAHPSWTPVHGSHVPGAIRGSLYLRRGAGEFRTFDIYHRVGELRVPITPAYTPHLGDVAETVYHEGFHAYQDERFAPLPEGRGAFGSASAVIALSVPAAEFEALAEEERRMLAAALDPPSDDSLRALLRGYLALRARRTELGPDVAGFERWEERMEGTAQYVGLLCAALATGDDAGQPRERIQSGLGDVLPALADGRPSKWRAYSVGAALALLLDDLRVPGWRAELEAGAALDQLLARALQGR